MNGVQRRGSDVSQVSHGPRNRVAPASAGGTEPPRNEGWYRGAARLIAYIDVIIAIWTLTISAIMAATLLWATFSDFGEPESVNAPTKHQKNVPNPNNLPDKGTMILLAIFTVVVTAIKAGELWLALRLVTATNPMTSPHDAIRICEFWLYYHISWLVLHFLSGATGGSSSVLTFIVRLVFVAVIYNFTQELKTLPRHH